jgi:ubiquinone/menaquinone biosynthesis C-methylase UbiE
MLGAVEAEPCPDYPAARYLGEVYGVDYSKDMVRCSIDFNRGLVAYGRVEVVEGTVDKTCFKDACFDLVTAIETYYFWSNVDEAFKEIRRILKPNGSLLVVSEMILDGVYEEKNAELITKTHVKLMLLEEIQKILRICGFSQVTIYRKKNLTGTPLSPKTNSALI